jgi:PAS domain S-box-containing protein
MAENGAVQNELTLRQFVDGISTPLAVMTPEGAVEIVNRQILDYFGKTLEELKAWSSSDAVHPDDLPGVIIGWKRSIESGQPFNSEHRQRGADGVYRWFRVHGLPVRDEDGRLLLWCVLQTDIDERKRNEAALTSAFEELAKSEAELRTIIDAIPQLIVTLRADGTFLAANQAVLDYTGLTKEEVRTESFRDVFHPEDTERLREQRDLAISRGVPFEYERRLRRRDGQYRWLLVQYNPLRDERGAVIRWYATGTDIDDRKRAEDALRSNEESLRLIVDNIPGFVSTANAAGELEHVSRQVLEYFGKTAEQMKNWAISDAHHPDDRARAIDAYKHSIETGEPLDCEARNRRADGVYRWFHVRGRPQRDADGRIVRWYNLVTDIDERKRAEEALGQSVNDNREMEDALRSTRRKLSAAMQIATVAEMSASIAHEINQPLASVVTNAHACQTWLSHDPPNLERAQATLDRIIRDGHSAAEVVRRIRALFKEAAPVKAPLDMNQIVAEVLRVLSDELRDNSIIVETELAADLPRIAGDHVQIQQTLINLVHNATEAMAGLTDRPKSLVLKSRRQGEELVIEVRDHGVGIKDPALVFEPFFTTKESGMGMGLSISRSIVEAHGGRIWATANEDAGTTFSVALPLASELSA